MAFPNLGQGPAMSQVGMPGRGPMPQMGKPVVGKALPTKKRPAMGMNPLLARQTLLAGLKG